MLQNKINKEKKFWEDVDPEFIKTLKCNSQFDEFKREHEFFTKFSGIKTLRMFLLGKKDPDVEAYLESNRD